MARIPAVGDHWRALEVLRHIAVYDDGGGYPSKHFLLRCDCGKTFERHTHNWLGKKKTSDCGCGIGKVVDIKVAVKEGSYRKINILVEHGYGDLEQAVNIILEAGLDSLLIITSKVEDKKE